MTPSARLTAVLEILAEIAPGTAPADRVVESYCRSRRYIGAKDRRAVSDRVYGLFRRRARLDWWLRRGDRRAPLRDRHRLIADLILADRLSPSDVARLFSGGGRYSPGPLNGNERVLVQRLADEPLNSDAMSVHVRGDAPDWLAGPLHTAFGAALEAELTALNGPAPLDLRLNPLKGDPATLRPAVTTALAATQPTEMPWAPLGIRLPERQPLEALPAFRDGWFEVQDEGSQLAALLVDARPGHQVVDFCAGADGKTLALAAAMNNKGRLVACDVVQGRLERARLRLRRAGVFNAELRLLTSERDAWIKKRQRRWDRVLIDAPCSGTGTWRRNPDAKWRLQPEDLDRLQEVQAALLASAARLVKPGGRLIYVTCSVLPVENEERIAHFLEEAKDEFRTADIAAIWDDVTGGRPQPEGLADFLVLTPARQGTDGFFVAILERRE